MSLDEIDLHILNVLKDNANQRVREIAKKVRKPITTVHNRIKKLGKEGVIKKYTIRVDERKLGNDIDAFVLVNISYHALTGSGINQEEVARKIKQLENVEEVCIITGLNDIIIRVHEKNIEKLNDFLINTLRKIPGVSKTQTLVILKSFSD